MLTVNEKAVKDEAELEALEKQIVEGSQPQDGEPAQPNNSQPTPAGEPTPQAEPAPAEPNTTSTVEPKPASTEKPADGGESDDEEMSQLSEKAQKRFRDLVDQKKKLEQELLQERKNRLLSQPGVGSKPASPTDNGSKGGSPTAPLPWDGSREITTEEYEKAVEDKAQKIVQGELKKEKMLASIRTDVKSIEGDYAEYNPDSEHYDEALVVRTSEWFKVLHKQNPDLSLRAFVDELMSIKSKGATEAKSTITAKVAKQAATQALSPTGVKANAQTTVEDRVKSAKTLKELEALEAEIGVANK